MPRRIFHLPARSVIPGLSRLHLRPGGQAVVIELLGGLEVLAGTVHLSLSLGHGYLGLLALLRAGPGLQVAEGCLRRGQGGSGGIPGGYCGVKLLRGKGACLEQLAGAGLLGAGVEGLSLSLGHRSPCSLDLLGPRSGIHQVAAGAGLLQRVAGRVVGGLSGVHLRLQFCALGARFPGGGEGTASPGGSRLSLSQCCLSLAKLLLTGAAEQLSQPRLSGVIGTLSLGDLGLQLRSVQRGQELVLLHRLTLLDIQSEQVPGDLGAHVHLSGLQRAVGVEYAGDRLGTVREEVPGRRANSGQEDEHENQRPGLLHGSVAANRRHRSWRRERSLRPCGGRLSSERY